MFFKHFASKNQLPGFYLSETLVENGLRLMSSVFKVLIFSTDLINKNIFRVSNYEFGSKLNVKNILVEPKLVSLRLITHFTSFTLNVFTVNLEHIVFCCC